MVIDDDGDDYGDDDGDGDTVVASQTRLSAILFLQTCRQAVDRYVTH